MTDNRAMPAFLGAIHALLVACESAETQGALIALLFAVGDSAGEAADAGRAVADAAELRRAAAAQPAQSPEAAA